MELLKSIFGHKRMLSLYWRIGGMAASELAFVVPTTLTDYQAPQWLIMGVGLIFGEITKALNKKNK